MKINDYFLGVVFIPILKEKLQNEEGLPKRILLIQRNGNNINVGDVKFS